MSEICCGSCHRPGHSMERCVHCGQPPLVDGRYALRRELGEGGSGITWLAEHVDSGQQVALKELSFRRMPSLKHLELFEREARTLRGLKHEAIPRYQEDFQIERAGQVSFYLAQEFVEGRALEVGEPTDEEQVVRLIIEVAHILDYLHSRRPPVIHRDIKPSNLMRRRTGELVLIDFGAVRAALNDPASGGSTVAGTFGYMAPEQLRGVATPASDVYGLGATALALLAGTDVGDLVDMARPDAWHDKVEMHKAMRALLSRMLAPREDERLRSAAEVITQAREVLVELRRPPAPKAGPLNVAAVQALRAGEGPALARDVVAFVDDMMPHGVGELSYVVLFTPYMLGVALLMVGGVLFELLKGLGWSALADIKAGSLVPIVAPWYIAIMPVAMALLWWGLPWLRGRLDGERGEMAKGRIISRLRARSVRRKVAGALLSPGLLGRVLAASVLFIVSMIGLVVQGGLLLFGLVDLPDSAGKPIFVTAAALWVLTTAWTVVVQRKGLWWRRLMPRLPVIWPAESLYHDKVHRALELIEGRHTAEALALIDRSIPSARLDEEQRGQLAMLRVLARVHATADSLDAKGLREDVHALGERAPLTRGHVRLLERSADAAFSDEDRVDDAVRFMRLAKARRRQLARL